MHVKCDCITSMGIEFLDNWISKMQNAEVLPWVDGVSCMYSIFQGVVLGDQLRVTNTKPKVVYVTVVKFQDMHIS